MGTGMRTPCLPILLTLGFLCRGSDASDHGRRQLLNAMVVGTVYCDTCFYQEFSKPSHFISGAVVAVECGEDATAKPVFRKEARTNKHGVFRVRLPLQIGKHLKSIQACSVNLVSSSEPFCAVASSATSSSLRLKSRNKRGLHVFSAGFFTFKPLQQPELCYQKPSPATSSPLGSTKTFAMPSSGTPVMDQKEDRPGFFLPSPPVPFVPSPFLPTNPLQPSPSAVPAIPFQPPPPAFFNVPLPRPTTPSAPPPGFRFPTFPFPPNPFFPGIPPAFSSNAGTP